MLERAIMPLLFVYKTLKTAGIREKLLGHAVSIIQNRAELQGFRVCNEGGDYHTIVQDQRSVVFGALLNVSEEDLLKLDEWESEYNRIEVQVNGVQAFVYQMKPEYLREQQNQETDDTAAEEEKILALAVERFETCKQNDHQKNDFDEDLKFKYGDQWRLDVAQDRQNDYRPMLTVNRCDNFVNVVVNQGLQNRPSIKVRPNDDRSDPMTADVIAGLVRHIINQQKAKIATDTAFEHAVSGGMGFVRILTKYCDDYSFDQEVSIERIENPCAVYFPDHVIKEQDYSDAPYCLIRQKISKKEFEEKWPDKLDEANGFPASVGNESWVEKDDVFIAEYYVVDREEKTIYLLPSDNNHQSPYLANEVPEGVTPLRERTTSKKIVKWYLMTQWSILDSKEVPGDRIPIFPILGKEMVINGKKHYISLIRNMKEVQKMFNYLWTAFIEAIQNAPKAPFIAEYSQIAKHKKYWDTANTKNWPYLPYTAKKDISGNYLPPPQRQSPPDAGASLITGLQYASEFMKDVTGIQDAALGAVSNERSGKAIEARKSQSNLSTYHYMNNYCNSLIAIVNYIIQIIPVIYDTPRAVRIVGEDMADKVVLVNQLHQDPENPSRLYDLTTGKYNVIVTIGPSYDTRRMETADMLGNLMQTAPQLTMIFFDILARVMDMPGGQEIAERAKRFINQQYPGVIAEEEMGTPEEQLRQQVQQMTADVQKLMMKSEIDEQQKQQLSEMLKAANDALKDKQEQIAATRENAILKAEVDTYKARLDLEKERIKQHTAHVGKVVDAAVAIKTARDGEKPEKSEKEGKNE